MRVIRNTVAFPCNSRADSSELLQEHDHADHTIWQDVYHAAWNGKTLYVKFQRVGVYFVISFKEQ